MTTAGDGLGATVVTLRELLGRGLRIPDYQRPYKWSVRNVAQLIDDVDTFRSGDRYRIGTVILHRERPDVLNVVDGQQRYLTFCLIAHFLAGAKDPASASVPDPVIPDVGLDVSRSNLVDNYAYIAEALGSRKDLAEWADWFFDQCEVVVLTLINVDEAFQMFDSQNTRGRPLFPSDLLKAFHIREMSAEHTSPALRLSMVRMWEDIPPESINALFSEYLFKIKRWANGRDVPYNGFSTEHIDMFKGIRESDTRNASNRWAMPFLYAKNYTDDFRQENATLIRYGAMPTVEYPFQIDQPVINGETFFMMVRHYYEMGLRCGLFRDVDPASEDLRRPNALAPVLETLEPHRGKATHGLVRNLFDCLLIYYLDRFDEQDLERAVSLIVRYAMALRIQQKQVRRVMVNRYALGFPPSENLLSLNLFRELREALRSQDFLRHVVPRPDPNGYEELLQFFDGVPA